VSPSQPGPPTPGESRCSVMGCKTFKLISRSAMSGPHPLPPNPLNHARSPPRDISPPARGFSRSGFAPIPYRHSELPPPPREREREFPRRDLDPEPEIERWERRMDREDWERRAPPHWEDDYGGSRLLTEMHRFLPTETYLPGRRAVCSSLKD